MDPAKLQSLIYDVEDTPLENEDVSVDADELSRDKESDDITADETGVGVEQQNDAHFAGEDFESILSQIDLPPATSQQETPSSSSTGQELEVEQENEIRCNDSKVLLLQ